jgi:dynein heavy chain
VQSGLFDALAAVDFAPGDARQIVGLRSREGEAVALAEPVDARGPAEAWLGRLVAGMQGEMRRRARDAAFEVYEQDLSEFLFNRPAQMALLGLQFRWAADASAALEAAAAGDRAAPGRALKEAERILRELVALALRPDLGKAQRAALEAAVTVHIHQVEASAELARARVKDPGDFLWLRQCRAAWREDLGTVMVSLCDVELEYSFEYLGVRERLVITPLTDACYVALTQALGMFLGGSVDWRIQNACQIDVFMFCYSCYNIIIKLKTQLLTHNLPHQPTTLSRSTTQAAPRPAPRARARPRRPRT